MGPRDVTTDKDELWARAEAHGYKKGAHNETDKVHGMSKHVTKTKKDQDRTLGRYIQWQLGAMRQDYARRGLPAPDEDAARSKYLGQGLAAPDLATVKDLLRFYIATSHPKLDVKRPTPDSINTVAEWFFAGFTRITHTETDEEERSEV